MSTHWKKLTNPDYLGAYALEPGQELTVTINTVKREMVTGADGKKEECTVCYFKESNIKPMILNSTNCKTITKLYATPYIEQWQNKQIILISEKVKAFGEIVDALRVKKTKPTSTVLKCPDCEQEIKAIGSYTPQQIAATNQKQYGRPICGNCSKKIKESEVAQNQPE